MTPRAKFDAAEAALNAAQKTYPAAAIEILKEAIQSIVGIKGDSFLVPDINLHVILVTKLGEAYFKDKQPDKAKQEFLNALCLVEKYKLDIYKNNILAIFNHLIDLATAANSFSECTIYFAAKNLFAFESDKNFPKGDLNVFYNKISDEEKTNYYLKNLLLQVFRILRQHFPVYVSERLDNQLSSDEKALPYEPPASIFYKKTKAAEITELTQLKNDVAQLRQEVAKLSETRQITTPRASSPRFGFAGN